MVQLRGVGCLLYGVVTIRVRMALRPESIQFGVAFPAAHPFSPNTFAKVAKPAKGQVVTMMAPQPGGALTPVLVTGTDRSVISYNPNAGVVSIQLQALSDVSAVGRRLILRLCRAAKTKESELRGWELQGSFVADSGSTAVQAIQSRLHGPPSWTRAVFGTEMANWGIRVIPKAASAWGRPFIELTPWLEVTVEPLVANPTKIFMGFIIREKTWRALAPKIRRLPALAQSTLDHVLG